MPFPVPAELEPALSHAFSPEPFRCRAARPVRHVPGRIQGGIDLPSLIERVRPAVVRISTFDADGQPLGSGSGFYGPDGRVVTNAHVLEGAARAEIFDPDGRLQGTTQYAEVSSTTVDIAILPRMGKSTRTAADGRCPPAGR